MAGILCIQMTSTIAKKDVNLKKVEFFIKNNKEKNIDLVVLPEFFSTGIHHESFMNDFEDENGGETIKIVCEIAKKYNVNIVAGTVITKKEDKLYNTCFAINRNGEILAKYDKIHLFNYMGGTEGDRITAGDKEVVVEFDFAKVGLGICFDIRYPLHYKKLAKMGAELIVLPTAWIVPPEVYEDKQNVKFARATWQAMNITRAYDNLLYCVSCNQIGKISQTNYGLGSSMIIAPTSQILADAKDKQCAIYADIDLELVKYYKSIYPIAEID